MRAFILLAGATLGLAACGSKDQIANNASVDESLSATSIASNDVTAIDAVTGDAANMAADVDVSFTNEQLASTGNRGGDKRSIRSSRSSAPQSNAPESNSSGQSAPTPQPTGNTAANSVE